MKTFQYEKLVIDPILKTIKKYQEYLTLPENLPQLAKLGFMYNTLWNAGRVCWGSVWGEDSKGKVKYEKGLLRPNNRGYGQCEDNPKYKIEMCKPENDRIEGYIYDAWGMHISEKEHPYNWEEFNTLITKGKPLSSHSQKLLKHNKTLEEWVDVLCDKEYKYSSIYPDRKFVVNHLMFTIGNGYGYKDGFIMQEASGADQDITDYGDWQNAIFTDEIQKVVDSILSYPEVAQTLDTACDYQIKSIERHNARHHPTIDLDALCMEKHGMTWAEYKKTDKYKDALKALSKKMPGIAALISEEEKYAQYYPICQYSIITQFDENTHPSYINAGIEACEEILAHKKEERKQNIDFAKKFLAKFKT